MIVSVICADIELRRQLLFVCLHIIYWFVYGVCLFVCIFVCDTTDLRLLCAPPEFHRLYYISLLSGYDRYRNPNDNAEII